MATMTNISFSSSFIFASNVPIDRLGEVTTKLSEVLTKVADGEEEDAFDLARMRDRVNREISTTLGQFEDDPHGYITGRVRSGIVVDDFVTDRMGNGISTVDLV